MNNNAITLFNLAMIRGTHTKKMSKDKIVVISLCGRGEKDLETIEEKIGKDFE